MKRILVFCLGKMKGIYESSLTNIEKEALKTIKDFVYKNFMGSEIFIYGSKIHGEFTQESDLDLLIIIPDLNWKMKKKIINKITEVNWKFNTNISPVVVSKEEWIKYPLIPLFQEVREKGLII
ncbi:nucleotidyltransferase domain-containing protein [Persephonella sp. KM09-Lau-8]|uniref:nucleotidyltransferase domain-containing protein n=1 Tax=Persephonella sp. KM09-Lau-8 TaxID=1158345 RepID=UPI0012DD987A|nr:nucleotidyltransferase domain-containing protein [Persephonella sp. KM09-Lau-8]